MYYYQCFESSGAEKKKLRLTSFLHLQLSFGLLQNRLDSLIGTCLWGADAGSNVTWRERKKKWEEMKKCVTLKTREQ